MSATRLNLNKHINLQSKNKTIHSVTMRKYRVGIQFDEQIRAISRHSGICFQTIPNYSEPIRKTFCISFDEKRSKIDQP